MAGKKETAEKIMITNFPVISENLQINELEKVLIKKTKDFESINYIYIVDKENKLIGTMSIKDIFRLSKDEYVYDVMQKKIIYAKKNTDQETVSLLALRHKLKAIPIIDKDYKLLGVVPFQTIINILNKENIEDFLYSAGISKFKNPETDIITANTYIQFKKRIPWLIFGLLGGILAAIFVSQFETIVSKYILLAAFMPAVVYLADAVGTQSQTIFIRSLALDKNLSIKKYVFREIKINLLLGLALSILFFGIIAIFWKDIFIALILGIAIFMTTIISMGTSLLLPIIFTKLNIDPAIASGPFATAVRDLLSILLYLSISLTIISII